MTAAVSIVVGVLVAAFLLGAVSSWIDSILEEPPAIAAPRNIGGKPHIERDGTNPILHVKEDTNGIPTLEQFEEALCELPYNVTEYKFEYTNFREYYLFEARKLNTGAWDVLILDQPSYGRRQTNGLATHRHDIGTPHQRICFTAGVEPYDLPDACRKALLWANLTSKYIRTGERF